MDIMLQIKQISIKIKLIIIFILLKVLPLLLLSYLALKSINFIQSRLENSTSEIIKQTQSSIGKTTSLAIKDSIVALDKQNQKMLEIETVMIANEIAKFLKERDRDILYLSGSDINQKNLEHFYKSHYSKIYKDAKYIYDPKKDMWIKVNKNSYPYIELDILPDNRKNFHKENQKEKEQISIPVYKEVSFYNLNGQEIYKVSSISDEKRDISKRVNTYLKAEDYFEKAKKLKKHEIYVSHVIGEYIPSKVIGAFTKKNAEKFDVDFKPQEYAYAGAENPVGKKYEGIIRFVTPVYKHEKKIGYVTVALDHRHIMNFTDYKNPFSATPLDIPDASKGNYAFLWDNEFRCISHPRDYFIMGYNKENGQMVPGWIDKKLQKEFELSKTENLNTFLYYIPPFFQQTFSKKPNLKQLKEGTVGLDCKYLNFAPQCHGWAELTKDGGYGSFIIFWSGLWKLTTAAAIPYYTGEYANSKIGFGFVTIGANVDDFHKSANETKKKVEKLAKKGGAKIKNKILYVSRLIKEEIKNQINHMSLITLLLVVFVIYIAILLANYLTKQLTYILEGIKKIKNQEFGYKIEVKSEDELGKLATAFNEMSKSIKDLNQNLHKKIYTDELTGLANRTSFIKDTSKKQNYIIYLCDIDFFKNINDYYGTEAGNFVLKSFAKVLSSFADKNSMRVYRLGSDEFVLLEVKEFDINEVKSKIEALHKLIARTKYKKDALNIDISISITCGIAYGYENLLEKADLALNEACSNKKDYLVFDHKNNKIIQQKDYIYWRKKIHYAIKNDEFVPFFQPIIDIRNKEIKKYESLIRMLDNGNIISPNLFLNVAKEAKLYPKLTRIMIKKTFKIFDTLDAKFSINISEIDIKDDTLVSYIITMLKKYNVKGKLILEILESEEIADFETVLEFIDKLRPYGVMFAIDDFGSGYSNFVYLSKFKPDFIKIDGSLIKNIDKDKDVYEIVKAIIRFAHILGSTIVAEYVQNEKTVEILRSMDVYMMQGYFFSEPKETPS